METGGIEIQQATVEDVNLVAPLFDAYRQFYRQPSDIQQAKQFLQDRLTRQESVIFLALESPKAVGFTQLYPSFSSGALRRILILNDLFVAPEQRRRGTGSALLRSAAEYGRLTGALRLVLSTEITNTTAQLVYERLGWKRDMVFCTYQLTL